MKRRLSNWLTAAWRKLNPRDPLPGLRADNHALSQALAAHQQQEAQRKREAAEFLAEMVEAQAMCGAGPWAPGDVNAYVAQSKPLREALKLSESGPIGDVSPLGAYGLYELLLQNVGWQREINYSWLEFTRWGIQQIILICRLYWLKNPIVRRLVNVCAEYVFARGIDISSDDPDANDILKAFLARNKRVLGIVALTDCERSKDRDGNLFWVFFPDKATGDCDLRMIDATEIQDIWTDPDDADVEQLFYRCWTERSHNPAEATQASVSRHAYYPHIHYQPAERPATINGHPVMWDTPVYHRKVGQVGKWLFGCPRIYPMVDWAKEARRFLEACASVRQSLSQFAYNVNTKGGQQAIEGVKQQMQTQVGPGAPIWDTNPPAVSGATWISGPGTTLEAFKVQGATFSPEDVRQYKLMCCMVKGVPETFLGDVATGNLATATSLDRPTETVFLSLQQEWIEDLTEICVYALTRSLRAPNGRLREACPSPGAITIRAGNRVRTPSGRWVYEQKRGVQRGDDIEVRVEFPAIREGDLPALVKATVEAMTLDNKGGQIVGIDEKAGVLELFRLLDIAGAEDLVEEMYPSKGTDKYDPSRAQDELPPPIPKLAPQAGTPPTPGEVDTVVDDAAKKPAAKAAEALRRVAEALEGRNGR